jgi:uncharacterized protein (DUF362 family)/Pyruvate/2-oxoacid:ferredoxin oxidoreductase delta subunit
MNNRIAVRKCGEYDVNKIVELISEIYSKTGGPEVNGRKVLVKPNILTDDDPAKCICTNPAVLEAMVVFLQKSGATVYVGDSPAVHLRKFYPDKSGIGAVVKKTNAIWVNFLENPIEKNLRKGTVKIASIVDEVDLIISLPKFKNHELVYFTGAIKNTLGLVPGFSKAKRHGMYQNRSSFGEFLVDLNEAVLPDYYFMDAVMGMEGPGPGGGFPKKVGLLLGSTNPLILDMTAARVAGYDPFVVPTIKTAYFRKNWLRSEEEIEYDGPALESLIVKDFIKIPVTENRNIALQFIMKRIKPLRKLERRPVFIHDNCTGCNKCVKICPVNAIEAHSSKSNYIVLTDKKCIRCFCCSEVCQDNAIEVRRKVFGI